MLSKENFWYGSDLGGNIKFETQHPISMWCESPCWGLLNHWTAFLAALGKKEGREGRRGAPQACPWSQRSLHSRQLPTRSHSVLLSSLQFTLSLSITSLPSQFFTVGSISAQCPYSLPKRSCACFHFFLSVLDLVLRFYNLLFSSWPALIAGASHLPFSFTSLCPMVWFFCSAKPSFSHIPLNLIICFSPLPHRVRFSPFFVQLKAVSPFPLLS